MRAADIDDRFTIADYLKREDRIFDEVRTHVEDVLPPAAAYTANRYIRASQSSPSRLDRNYNRSYVPETIRGGALLVHGLTDSPYSMRAIAEQLRADGYYSLALRMPGHGTVPQGSSRAALPTGRPRSDLGSGTCDRGLGPDYRWCSSAIGMGARSSPGTRSIRSRMRRPPP